MEPTKAEEESRSDENKSDNKEEDSQKTSESSVFFRSEYAKKDFWNSRFEK